MHMCMDHQAINGVIEKDKCPLPRKADCLDQLSDTIIFSKINLSQVYHQMHLTVTHISKTLFSCQYDHFVWVVLLFRLTNTPSDFQWVTNHILGPYLDQFILVYLDDILIYSKTEEEYIVYMKKVLQALEDHDLFCHPKKSVFGFHKIKFVGHMVSGEGISMDEDNILAIKTWPWLTNTSEVHAFLGLASYYWHFI